MGRSFCSWRRFLALNSRSQSKLPGNPITISTANPRRCARRQRSGLDAFSMVCEIRGCQLLQDSMAANVDEEAPVGAEAEGGGILSWEA